LLEVMTHVLPGCIPDRKEHALSLVTAGTILVGLAEVTDGDGSVDGGDDLGQLDVLRALREHVTATHASFRSDESRTFQSEEDLFEIGLGESGALGYVANRGWSGRIGMQSEREQRSACIIAPR
jgi:hypothetical protein